MKTTVELPDDLLIAAKKRAAELRRPLRSLIEDGLRSQLEVKAQGKRSWRRKFKWITSKGGLPPGVDVSNRVSLHNWIQSERDRAR